MAIGKPLNSIRKLRDLFRIMESSRPRAGFVNVYRGHANQTYTLQPSLFRKKEHRRVEKNILRELISIQPSEFRDDLTAFERLVRMQHYGLPTRLLDFTYNPLVGLYFACSDNTNDGQIIRFSLPKSNVKYFDSDTVSCIANLSNLTARQRNQVRNFTNDEDLRKSDVGERLLHFIKAEKPYFLPKIVVSELKSICAVHPKQSNRRIIAQQGGFFIFGLKSILNDTNDFEIEVHRTLVPRSAKRDIISELDAININPSTLFPEIESAAKYIMSKIPTSDDSDYEPD